MPPDTGCSMREGPCIRQADIAGKSCVPGSVELTGVLTNKPLVGSARNSPSASGTSVKSLVALEWVVSVPYGSKLPLATVADPTGTSQGFPGLIPPRWNGLPAPPELPPGPSAILLAGAGAPSPSGTSVKCPVTSEWVLPVNEPVQRRP